MKYSSTRGSGHLVTLSEAIRVGLAADGGLFVPAGLPRLDRLSATEPLAALAAAVLAPFAAEDELGADLPAICREAFDFPAPLVPLQAEGPVSALELFHGPTCAFKDFGARFLAASLERLCAGSRGPLT